jgi:hypothetical protein
MVRIYEDENKKVLPVIRTIRVIRVKNAGGDEPTIYGCRKKGAEGGVPKRTRRWPDAKRTDPPGASTTPGPVCTKSVL